MDGIINFNKPTGISSAKALYGVRAATGQRKSGHAGTLDPGASGVLILCMGKATKLVEKLMDQPKIYRTTARLDVTSESFDVDRPLIPIDVTQPPSLAHVASTLAGFEGESLQVPPAISAVKIKGVPAYKRVRNGEEFKLRPKLVRIYWIALLRYDWPKIEFEMACGRGTYVRGLIRDLGQNLGTGGCLTKLTRTQVGPFTLDSSCTLDDLGSADIEDQYLLKIEKARELLDQPPVIPKRPIQSALTLDSKL